MTASLSPRPRARLDLIKLWAYIADDNPNAADRLLERIESSLVLLQENPFSGRARPELGEGIRSKVVGNYILFYRPLGPAIELVRVLEGHMDITADTMSAE